MGKKEVQISSRLIQSAIYGYTAAIVCIVLIHFFGKFTGNGNFLEQHIYRYQLQCPLGLAEHEFEGSKGLWGSIYSNELSGLKILQILISIKDHPFLVLFTGAIFTSLFYFQQKVKFRIVKEE